MPMTPELRRGIGRIRDYLFGGGYPNPAQNAEQLSFLIYPYLREARTRRGHARRDGRAPRPMRAPTKASGTCATPHAMPEPPARRRCPASSCAGPPGRMR